MGRVDDTQYPYCARFRKRAYADISKTRTSSYFWSVYAILSFLQTYHFTIFIYNTTPRCKRYDFDIASVFLNYADLVNNELVPDLERSATARTWLTPGLASPGAADR